MALKSPLIVVERKSPWYYLQWGVFAIIVLVIVFGLGRLEDRASRTRLTRQAESLQAKVDELGQQLRNEQSTHARSTQNNAVDNMASAELQQTLKTLQDSVKELEKENAFYRGIMNPGADHAGLAIDSFSVISYGSDNRYRYKLTLTQLRNHEVDLKGRVKVSLSGLEGGASKTYDLFVISGAHDPAQGFNFRYFQNIEGEVVIPAGFTPKDVHVSAAAEGRNALDRVFPWEQSRAAQ